jgi:hypothetical protein
MKKMKIPAVLATCAACVLSLFGCGKDHILDGPGMVNDLTWTEFTVTRSDSYAQHNFWFTVEYRESGFFLTGECRDENGNLLENEEGILVSTETVRALRSLMLGDLPDAKPDSAGDDVLLLDAPDYSLLLTYMDGSRQEKAITDELSLLIYRHFLPYFTA